MLARPHHAGPDDLALALRLRGGLRERLGVPVGDQPAAALLADADLALRELPLLATVGGAPPAADPTATTATGPTQDAAPAHDADPAAGVGAESAAAETAAGGAGVGLALVPAPGLPPVRRGLAAVAVAWSELVLAGDAARLKRCAEHECAWVFWDVSKNRSRRWCSMRVCGNRNKARRFAAKRAVASSATTRPN
ncbi:CGNR zinc finger domain-containing protein [Streptomyces sp. 71268]|uniref:CGNR zinc finger domain-containing protein n=1 Tax=Streptomyces sp. 71268 TaxID=3002640 RepID=UPI0023F828B8|nr:CGNR zinc finger domain-containing protein [Streptomyces sp. 71268]WEV29699.1 CGNR zinc finger domain-containing protein [Streptomyces sp. 71268]